MADRFDTEIARALSDRSVLAKALFNRPESLSMLLPYGEYLDKHGVFVMKDGSLGAVFEMELFEHEPMTEAEILKATSATKRWFTLPESCTLQFYFDTSYYPANDNRMLSLERSFPQSNAVSRMLFGKKFDVIKASCQKQSGNIPVNRKLMVSLRYLPPKRQKVGKSINGPYRTLDKETREFKQRLADFIHIKKGLVGDDSNLKSLDSEQLGDFLRRFFNPVTYYKRAFAPINKRSSLSDQIIYSTPRLDYSGIEREGIKTRTITLKTSPAFSYPGGMAQFVKLKFPFRISINVSFPAPAKVKNFLAVKEFFLENAMTARARLQQEELNAVQEALARDDRVLQMTFCVIIEGQSGEELDDRARKICQIFNNDLECEVIQESDIGLGLCLNTLPLHYVSDADPSTRRAIRILKSDIMNFIPLFDSFRGFKDPVALYLSRENNLVPFSLLENETSNHTVVLADTGSGKSAFVIDCIQSVKRLDPEPIVFVIDKKSSYSMLSRYYDGDLTVFDRDKEIPFSPFRGVYNDEKIAFLTKMITMAIKLTSPSFVMESEHQTAISEALKFAYTKKCQREGLEYIDGELIRKQVGEQVAIDMNDFAVELGSLARDRFGKADFVSTLLSKLKPFYGDGIYAKFFTEGQGAEEKQKLFYVYDLDALDGDPVLQALMTMSVIEEIRCILSLPCHQGRTGFLIMEEFAMLGRNNPAFRDFAIDFAETMRKRGCWLITLTPRPQNYFDSEVGKAFWGVADNFLFLQMSSDNVDYICQKSTLFDEANREILRSLRTKKGDFADVFYMNKSKTKQGAFRFRQTKYDRWISPTNATDAVAVLKALDKFPDKWQALDYLVAQS